MSTRVVQWATGNVGSRALRAIILHPELELVGVHVHDAAKVGRDAGSLAGLDPTGIVATSDADALIAMRPDCISYAAIEPDVELLVRFLESGINVVTTSMFMTGFRLGRDAAQRIEQAGRKGNASIFGSGIQPGVAEYLALVSAGVCERIDQVRITETVDSTGYAAPDVWRECGFGYPADHPGLSDMTRRFTAVFGDAVELMAGTLALELDEIVCEPQYAVATEDIVLPYMTIEKGQVAGVKYEWAGVAHGRKVVVLEGIWRIGYTMEPDWPVKEGWYVEITGVPDVKSQLTVAPPAEWDRSEWPGLFGVITAMPIVHAIGCVCRARPGIVTYADLPLVTAAHSVA